ncbi:hypothetical protein P7K49_003264, partial [Saguinus oedipus]
LCRFTIATPKQSGHPAFHRFHLWHCVHGSTILPAEQFFWKPPEAHRFETETSALPGLPVLSSGAEHSRQDPWVVRR